jgi:hypothetical protein
MHSLPPRHASAANRASIRSSFAPWTKISPSWFRATTKRRGVRYPLAVLLAIAVLAKLCGDSQVHALADWAHARAAALAAVFELPRPRMPHPTTWTRVLGNAVAAAAIETALQPLLEPPPTAEVPARASRQIALDGKTLRGTIPATARSGVHLVTAYQVDTGVPCL